MAISKQFKTGNYNEWENLVEVTLANINASIRNEIIPLIEETLLTMLGNRSAINRSKLEVIQDCKQELKGIYLNIEYDVEDWNVPEAPKSAIEADENVLKETFVVEGKELSNLEIDTTSGKLSIQYYIPVSE